jgi:hypothetical protein
MVDLDYIDDDGGEGQYRGHGGKKNQPAPAKFQPMIEGVHSNPLVGRIRCGKAEKDSKSRHTYLIE